MCGICGAIDFNKNAKVDEELIRKMCGALSHRGPDDEGVYIKDGSPAAGLGHRRLSIIDLSVLGHQPMCNEDASIWVVLNGEIYNFNGLKSELEEKGHSFKSHTDTEVILHLYEEYQEECVKYLRGMFAFAIWDEGQKKLFLARDRVGKKPLLYSHRDGRFIFSSEFASLVDSGVIPKAINKAAVDYYLSFGYVPAPYSIYKDIFKLPPAHIAVVKDNQIKVSQYWQLDYSNKIKISEEEAGEEILRLLKEAVDLRLYSDVPLGAFLSGGIDSSLVVALMSESGARKIKTFSIGFQEASFNELSYAKEVARRFNTDHREFVVKPNAIEILPLLVERYGEPYADSSAVPSYYVSRETKRFVTVALNGDGGDENFAGYERYQGVLISEIYNRLPSLIKDGFIGNIARLLPDSLDLKNPLRMARRFFAVAHQPLAKRYLRWIGMFSDLLKNEIYAEAFKREIAQLSAESWINKYLLEYKNLGTVDMLLATDVQSYLPNDLLVKMDIASMANSLEARSPFLDHIFMEFTASLPASMKIKRFLTKKYILKKAIGDLLPKEIIHRRKMGFGVPVGSWFRGELRPLLQDTVLSRKALSRGYFNPERVKNIVRQHTEGKTDYGFQIWTLLMLELWHQRFID